MGSRSRRSKQRSAGKKSPPQPDPVFFVDRCLGRLDVANYLREAGWTVVVHDDHFPQGCDDGDWIPVVAKRNWVILTKDGRMRNRIGRHAHREALENAKACAFMLRSRQLTAEQMANAFLHARTAILNRIARYTRPLIVLVSRDGDLDVVAGQRRGGVSR